MRYLDPKNDLTFKKIFGQHPDILTDLLNSILSLENPIVSLVYLDPNEVPEIPFFKNSIVDVKCTDNKGRIFVVEMQMLWTPAFMYRVLFNASKAYVRQLEKGKTYKYLNPVYSINFVNDVFIHDSLQNVHTYKIIHVDYPTKCIDGLEFLFIEIPKDIPKDSKLSKMGDLWLQFFKEVKHDITVVSESLRQNPLIVKSLDIVEESAFTREELEVYDRYWDGISRERTLIEEGIEEGIEKGIKEGIEKGIKKGIEKGKAEGIKEGIAKGKAEGIKEGVEKGKAEGIEEGKAIERALMVKSLSLNNIPKEMIAQALKITVEEVEKLLE